MYVTVFKSLIIESSVIDFADESIILLETSLNLFLKAIGLQRSSLNRKKSMEKLFFNRFY